MNRQTIERFFKELAKGYPGPVTIYLTGAAAGTLMGSTRNSLDVDFGVEMEDQGDPNWSRLEVAIEKSQKLTGFGTNYAEDIDRWGLITLMDYKKHVKLFKKFGKLKVKILEPAYWSIGKMTRYLQPDIEDMKVVFQKQKVAASVLAQIWGKALKNSSKSTKLSLFRKQVEDFLIHSGPEIWGPSFDVSGVTQQFHRSAGIHSLR